MKNGGSAAKLKKMKHSFLKWLKCTIKSYIVMQTNMVQ